MRPLDPTPSADNVIALLARDARHPDYRRTLAAVRLWCDVELARVGLALPTLTGGGHAAGVVREVPEAARLAAGGSATGGSAT